MRGLGRGSAAAVLIASVAVAASAAAAPAAGWHRVASARKYALYADLSLAADVRRPAALALRVVSQPAQSVSVKWRVTCTKGGSRRSSTGSYTAHSTALQSLRLPLDAPGSCHVSAYGILVAGGGTLTMGIYSRSA